MNCIHRPLFISRSSQMSRLPLPWNWGARDGNGTAIGFRSRLANTESLDRGADRKPFNVYEEETHAPYHRQGLGKSDKQKRQLADEITRDVMAVLDSSDVGRVSKR